MFVSSTLGSVCPTPITDSKQPSSADKHQVPLASPVTGVELLMQQRGAGRSAPFTYQKETQSQPWHRMLKVVLAENPLESTGSPYRILLQMLPVCH